MEINNSSLSTKSQRRTREIAKLTEEVSNLKKQIHELQELVEYHIQLNKNLNEEIENLERENSKIYKESESLIALEIEKYQKLEKRFREFQNLSKTRETNLREERIRFKKEIEAFQQSRSDVQYFKHYSSLVFRLKELYECPISCSNLTSPIILPSGITIQDSFFDELVKHNTVDPYNKNLRIRQRIVNRFAERVKEVIEGIEKEVIKDGDKIQNISELQKQSTADSSFQAELFTRSDEDIETIKQLEHKISYLNDKIHEITLKLKHTQEELKQSDELRKNFEDSIKHLLITHIKPNSSSECRSEDQESEVEEY